ncbi:MAG: hypothetical protein OWU84_02595 [Firmicutes bacterium]|nr:hypothetical protein [Bacillota bacterium]
MRLPLTVQRLFYRYHADRLDSDRHAEIIISTVLADGNLDDWEWLFAVYGWNALAKWIAEPAHRNLLPPPMASFRTLILVGQSDPTSRWGGPHRLVPPDALPDWFPDALR